MFKEFIIGIDHRVICIGVNLSHVLKLNAPVCNL